MTETEELIRLVLNNVYTSLPCKVVKFNSGSHFATVTPEVYSKGDAGAIINVPVLRMIGGKVPVKSGMVIPVFFSKYALGEYLMNNSKVEVGGPLKELQFDRDNAYALPFLFEREGEKFAMPDKVIFDTEVEFQKHITCLETAKFLKHTDFMLTTTFVQKASFIKDLGTPNVSSFENHTHPYKPGSGTPTSTGGAE